MKAKIRKTGEIIDVVSYGATGDYVRYINSNGEVHSKPMNYYTDIEEIETIDWEQRRYETAKEILKCLIQSNDVVRYITERTEGTKHHQNQLFALTAKNLADELIKQLKNETV